MNRKHLKIIKAAAVAFVFIFSLSGRTIAFAEVSEPDNTVPKDYEVNKDTQGDALYGLYDRFFLKDDIQEIRIEIKEENLKFLLNNAADKVSVLADKVTIGGESVMYTGLKTKGDYTLQHGVTDNHSNRYSFTINFGKYVKKAEFGEKQDFYGLRKLSLNNFFFDKSMLKEYTAYYLISRMGLPCSQYGLTKLYVNDKYYGVYFMVEAFDYSILEQYYGKKKGELGKFLTKPVGTDLEYNDIARDPGLLWDHDEDTYKDIEEDVPMALESIKKLNALSNGKDFDGNAIEVNSAEYVDLLGTVLDLDEALRYFAVHSFLVQTDNMFTVQHNYGLYCEPDGRLVVIPWDYDLSYGTYFPSTAENTANYDVDIMYNMYVSWQDYDNSEYSAETYAGFPLFNVIYQNDELMEQYHTYMLDCAKIMALGGTTSDGETFAPANMYNILEGLSDKLIAAASLKNAAGAGYMNRISQPSDVKKGIPNIEKIIAQRAVGVYSQLSDECGWVSAQNCDLSSVGNGQRGNGKRSGDLTVVDEKTSAFFTATYRGGAPVAGFSWYETESEEYKAFVTAYEEQIKGEIFGENSRKQKKNRFEISLFDMTDKGVPVSAYRIGVPVEEMPDGKDEALYIYHADEEGKLQKLEYSTDGNIVLFDSETLGKFAIVRASLKAGTEEDPSNPAGDNDEKNADKKKTGAISSAAAAGMAAVAAAAFLAIRRKKKQ